MNTNGKLSIRDELTDFLMYTGPDGQVKVEVVLQDETIWLPQKKLWEKTTQIQSLATVIWLMFIMTWAITLWH